MSDTPTPSVAERPVNLDATLRSDAAAMATELADLRHTLHQCPELGLELPQTRDLVLAALRELDLEITTDSELSSVVAVLHGAQPGPVVLLRGDMDGLPVEEQTDVSFRSTNGAMHACGHDLHTTGLVGAARLLAARRDQIAGSVIFMFQPGEEGVGGADIMVSHGVLEAAGRRPDAAFAIHVAANMPRGLVFWRKGPMMAAVNEFTTTFHGAGGHGSMPHAAKDPVPAACEAVLALQTMVTRECSIWDPAVVTVGSIHAGDFANVIPPSATIKATVRSFSADTVNRLRVAIPRVLDGVAQAHGLRAETDWIDQYPATSSDPAWAERAAAVASDLLGVDRVREFPHPVAGSEDFSVVLEKIPGAFLFVGAGAPDATLLGTPSNHSPLATFDDSVLPDQAALLAGLALDALATSAASADPS